MTKQRAIILKLIRSELYHPTAEEIFEAARLELPSISRATVYNNLRSMQDEGLIRRIGGEGNSDRFDFNTSPHGHLFCSVCGKITDVMLPGLKESIERASDSVAEEYELRISGVCSNCKNAIQNKK